MHVHDTSDADNECQLWLWFNEEVSVVTCLTTEVNERALLRTVLLDVLFCTLEGFGTTLVVLLLPFSSSPPLDFSADVHNLL